MNFQYYESLLDKSKKYVSYLVKEIVPKFTIKELPILLDDINKIPLKTKKGSDSLKIKGFIKIGDDYETQASLSNLSLEKLKLMYHVFISRERSDKLAVKWRFYQYLKYIRGFFIKNIYVNRTVANDISIDFIIETSEGKMIFVLCFDVLDLKKYKKAIENINNFLKSEKLTPETAIFATSKTYRDLPFDNPVKINSSEFIPELWVEWIEYNCPFNGEDLIIVNNSDLKIAGFNFINTDDVLNYIYEFSEDGEITVFRQKNFFSEFVNEEPEVELIWKGIMLKEVNS